MPAFTIEVTCKSGGNQHTHTLSIQTGSGVVYGASRPGNVRLQYTCPTTQEALMATFAPPVGAARPFTVTGVH